MHLTVLFMSYVLLSWVGHLVGSSLLGSFVAGMLFSNVRRSQVVWSRQFKRVTAWLLRLFFGATVAFTINIESLLTLQAFWKGIVIGVVPCLGGKLVCGLFVGSERWVIGVAMMARGEFAYLVAEAAHSLDLLSSEGYSVILWSLLWATVIPPMIFAQTLQSYVLSLIEKGACAGRSERIGGVQYSAESSFIIRFIGQYRVGMVREICDMLFSRGLDVLQSSTESDGLIGTGSFVVSPREAIAYRNKHKLKKQGRSSLELKKYQIVTDLDDAKLDELAQALKDTVGDDNTIVVFEHADKETEIEKLDIMEIKLIGPHSSDIVEELTRYLVRRCNLEVSKAQVDKEDSDFVILYCRKLDLKTSDKVRESDETSRQDFEDKIITTRRATDGSIIQRKSATSLSAFDNKAIETFTRVYPKIHASRHLSLSEIKPSAIGTLKSASNANLRSHMYHNVQSAFSAAQREHIRVVIQNLFNSRGIEVAYALVRMIHVSEMLTLEDNFLHVNAADLENKQAQHNEITEINMEKEVNGKQDIKEIQLLGIPKSMTSVI